METELASLVRRHGGDPLCTPALRELERECTGDVARAVDALQGGNSVVVLATGVGLERWLSVAATLGREDELRDALVASTVVCRGPKPVAVLKRQGLEAHVRAAPPHTTKELLLALEGVDVRGRTAIFVHDGGANRTVPEALLSRGARVVEVQPYVWALPEDIAPLRGLVAAIVGGRVDVVAFTTQIQAKHLFDVAEMSGSRAALVDAFRERVLVAAVGPTCAQVLADLGAPPHVVPEQAKMGALVLALARRLSARGLGSTGP
jgi:uroporphyrinogen-III synthase